MTDAELPARAGRKIFRVDEQLFCFLAGSMKATAETWSIPAWPEMPADAKVIAVFPRHQSRSLDFVVESETFHAAAPGCELEVVPIMDWRTKVLSFPNPYLPPAP